MTALGFNELGPHRVQAETLIPNARSQRVLERVGFVRDGTAPEYPKITGRGHDPLMCQLRTDSR